MWMGACASSIGTWMQEMAQSWLVLQLSNSPFLLGLNAFLNGLPIFLFSLVGGVVADRIERRKVLLISQLIQMSCAFLLTLLIATHLIQVWHILISSFVTGLAQAFGGPAYQALIPSLVDKEDMPNAIALQSIQFNVARVIGPVVGGITMAQLGNVWCFGLNGLSFLAPIISLLTLKARFYPAKTKESILQGMKQGISFIHGQSAMVSLMLLAFCMTALGVPMMTFLPVFVKNVFRQGPTTLTLFLSMQGAGSILGALTMASLGNVKRKGRIALILLTCLGIGIAGFAASTNLWLSCVMLFITGASLISVFALVNSLVQLITTNEMRGRVMSVYNFAFRGGMPMGNLLTGWLVPIFTAPAVLAVNGLILMVVALYFLAVQRRVAAL